MAGSSRYFAIAREEASLSVERFKRLYFDTETPVLIEQIAADWPAVGQWTEKYIRERLAGEPDAATTSLWYWVEREMLQEDYQTPEIINHLTTASDVFPRDRRGMRIWIHAQGHVSSWHYDTNMVNVFNVQVTGSKEWLLVSPDSPLTCYPFTNFAIIDGQDEKNLAGRIHTRFTLQAGDMLYIPPLWFHKVMAEAQENINLNWVFTKTKTRVASKTLQRELERYALHEYLTHHRFPWVRNTFNRLNRRLPAYVKWRWRYAHMLDNPLQPRSFALTRRTLRELSALGKMVLHAGKGRQYLENLRTVEKLPRSYKKR